MQDREDRAVAHRVQELRRVPAGGQRARLGLAVAHHRRHHQVGVVERRTEGVGQRVTELAALVDRAGRLRGDVAGDAPREAELLEQPSDPHLVVGHVGVDLAVGAVQPGRGDQARTAVPRPGDVEDLQVAGQDRAVEVGVDERQAGRGSPVPQQPGLGVLGLQRLTQQRVAHQVDLADGQVVGRPPPGLQARELVVGEVVLGRSAVVSHLRHGVSKARPDRPHKAVVPGSP